eukprot:m.327441 g.327441  ORF g.327441 m.327441 type:complete len:458 (+) comp27682_c0_seq1:150-1523(+)
MQCTRRCSPSEGNGVHRRKERSVAELWICRCRCRGCRRRCSAVLCWLRLLWPWRGWLVRKPSIFLARLRLLWLGWRSLKPSILLARLRRPWLGSPNRKLGILLLLRGRRSGGWAGNETVGWHQRVPQRGWRAHPLRLELVAAGACRPAVGRPFLGPTKPLDRGDVGARGEDCGRAEPGLHCRHHLLEDLLVPPLLEQGREAWRGGNSLLCEVPKVFSDDAFVGWGQPARLLELVDQPVEVHKHVGSDGDFFCSAKGSEFRRQACVDCIPGCRRLLLVPFEDELDVRLGLELERHGAGQWQRVAVVVEVVLFADIRQAVNVNVPNRGSIKKLLRLLDVLRVGEGHLVVDVVLVVALHELLPHFAHDAVRRCLLRVEPAPTTTFNINGHLGEWFQTEWRRGQRFIQRLDPEGPAIATFFDVRLDAVQRVRNRRVRCLPVVYATLCNCTVNLFVVWKLAS